MKQIIRTEKAGVFYGEITNRIGTEVEIKDCCRLWYWDGAASLSQLAAEGTSKPRDCKFTVTVPVITVFGVIEIIPCTEKAEASIEAVKKWKV